MTGLATKTIAGLTFMASGGILAVKQAVDQAVQHRPPPPDLNFIEYFEFYSKGISTLTSAAIGGLGALFLILRHFETKRHNKAMEPTKEAADERKAQGLPCKRQSDKL